MFCSPFRYKMPGETDAMYNAHIKRQHIEQCVVGAIFICIAVGFATAPFWLFVK